VIPEGDGSRAATWAARLLAGVSILLAAIAVALPLVGGLDYLPRLFSSPEIVVALAYSTTGALLVGHRRARSIGWLLLGIGVVAAVYVSSVSYVAWLLEGNAEAALPVDADPLATVAAWMTTWAWFPAWFAVATVLPQLVPDGRLLGPRWRLLLGATLLVGLLAVLDFATSPGQLGFFTRIENPVGSPALADLLSPVTGALDAAFMALIALSLASVVLRFLRADGVQRRQIGWFGYAVVLTVGVILVGPGWAVNAAVLLIPAGIAVAAFRYRLFDLDLVANRTLVAVLLLGSGAVAYLALAAWVGALVGTSGGITPFVAALAVALVFHPARLFAQRWVDRLFFGRRGDPLALLRDLDQVLREADTPRSALAGAVELIRDGLRLAGAAVVVERPHGGAVRAQAGSVPEEAVVLPLVLHEQQVGVFHVAPRGAERRLGDADLRVLSALTGPLTSAAYALLLSGDLEESHRRLLSAREDERRRLRRDLHDGLGPQLAGAVMGLDVMRSALDRGDPARAKGLAGVVSDQVRGAVEDVRRLVSGLRPPVLDDLGLLGALRATWPVVSGEGPAVTITAEGALDDLPAAVEVAAYRIVQEAVTNAVRHARATAIDVHVAATAEALCVRVEDDGDGVGPGAGGGVGLASMRERAAELGGWCTVSTGEERGTRVLAHLPKGT
jgi:two-component system NarL family sensor kinase